MRNNGANQSTIKRSNRRLIFDVLNKERMCSRTQLSEITHLTKASVTYIVSEMIEGGVIREGEVTGSGIGRKSIMLEISPHSPRTLSLSINRDALFVSLVNLKGEILFEKRILLTKTETEESLLKKIFRGCDCAIRANEGWPLWGIGVASIGPVDSKNGSIISPPNFSGIRSIQIVEPLKARYGMNVALDNDMNAAAIGEKLFGFGSCYENFIFVGISRGIGGGIILNNELYRGGDGLAGEIGHISIDYRGRLCQCGAKGCLEMYASIAALEEEAERMKADYPESLLASGDIQWSRIVEAARKKDPFAEKMIASMIEYLSAGLVSVCNTYNPQIIFLGYEGALASDLIIEPLKERINESIFSKDFSKINIQTSFFKTDSYKVSGAAVLIDKHLG